jgi:hypothetical protein
MSFAEGACKSVLDTYQPDSASNIELHSELKEHHFDDAYLSKV